jgi:hypothetical protein
MVFWWVCRAVLLSEWEPLDRSLAVEGHCGMRGTATG